jgi:predicted DNA-binding transcriptional regulator AlpA
MRLLTVPEVAAQLQVSAKQVRRLPIPQVRLGPRTIRYRPEDVAGWIVGRRLAPCHTDPAAGAHTFSTASSLVSAVSDALRAPPTAGRSTP